MSAHLQADAAQAVTSGSRESASDNDALYRRIGARIVPFLFICYIVSILDRSNIGFAQLQMRQDLGLTDAMYSLGAVLFFVGYVFCEVTNMTCYVVMQIDHFFSMIREQSLCTKTSLRECRHA